MGPSDRIGSPVNGETSWRTGLGLGLALWLGVGGDSSVVLPAQPLQPRPMPTTAVIEAARTKVVCARLMFWPLSYGVRLASIWSKSPYPL
jgi:hypothetical protein